MLLLAKAEQDVYEFISSGQKDNLRKIELRN